MDLLFVHRVILDDKQTVTKLIVVSFKRSSDLTTKNKLLFEV